MTRVMCWRQVSRSVTMVTGVSTVEMQMGVDRCSRLNSSNACVNLKTVCSSVLPDSSYVLAPSFALCYHGYGCFYCRNANGRRPVL